MNGRMATTVLKSRQDWRSRTGGLRRQAALALNVAGAHPDRDAMRGGTKRAEWDDGFLLDMVRKAARVA